jgi:hypothetical protein
LFDLVDQDRPVQVVGGAPVPSGADQRVVAAAFLVAQREPCPVERQQPVQRLEQRRSALGRLVGRCRDLRHLDRDVPWVRWSMHGPASSAAAPAGLVGRSADAPRCGFGVCWRW